MVWQFRTSIIYLIIESSNKSITAWTRRAAVMTFQRPKGFRPWKGTMLRIKTAFVRFLWDTERQIIINAWRWVFIYNNGHWTRWTRPCHRQQEDHTFYCGILLKDGLHAWWGQCHNDMRKALLFHLTKLESSNSCLEQELEVTISHASRRFQDAEERIAFVEQLCVDIGNKNTTLHVGHRENTFR